MDTIIYDMDNVNPNVLAIVVFIKFYTKPTS